MNTLCSIVAYIAIACRHKMNMPSYLTVPSNGLFLSKSFEEWGVQKSVFQCHFKTSQIAGSSDYSIPFKQLRHHLNKHARFSLTEQINNIINSDIDTIKIRLIRKQDFWILKLDTLTLEGLNHELNNV